VYDVNAGVIAERVRYSAYGVPFCIAAADFDGDGDVDSADNTAYSNANTAGDPSADLNLDSVVDFNDTLAWNNLYNVGETGGRSVLSRTSVRNRIGYAGYQHDPSITGSAQGSGQGKYHVRFRVYDAGIGRWTRRDPLGYVDGPTLYASLKGNPVSGLDPTGLRWSNFNFVNWYFEGGGAAVDLAAIGLLQEYQNHPAIVRRIEIARGRARAMGSAAAQEAVSQLRCGCSGAPQTALVEVNGVLRLPVSRREFLEPLMSGLRNLILTPPSFGAYGMHEWTVAPLNYFWLVDWTFSIGGHSFNANINCKGFAECPTPPDHRGEWWYSCSIDYNMADIFAWPLDLDSISRGLTGGMELAEAIDLSLRAYMLRFGWTAGTSYAISGKWLDPVGAYGTGRFNKNLGPPCANNEEVKE